MEHLAADITVFVGGSDVFKAAKEASEMSHDLEHQKRPGTRIPSIW